MKGTPGTLQEGGASFATTHWSIVAQSGNPPGQFGDPAGLSPTGPRVPVAEPGPALPNGEAQAIAIAIEIVLVFGTPSVVTPTNLALAINDQCTLCETLASAYQFVLGTGGPVHFSSEGNKSIAELRHDFKDLGKSDLTIDQIQAQVADLVGQLKTVLANDLVPVGKPEEQPGAEGQTQTGPTGPPTTSSQTTPPTTTGQTETTPTATSETTPTATSEPAPTFTTPTWTTTSTVPTETTAVTTTSTTDTTTTP